MTPTRLDDRAETFNCRARLQGWTVAFDRSLSFERPELAEFCALWKEKAKSHGGIPPRSAFDARTVKPFIRNITIAERVAISHNAWRYRFRIFSSALAQITGDKTGRFLDEVVEPKHAVMWTDCYDTVLERPRPLRFINRYQASIVDYLVGESCCAPLGDNPAAPDMLLSCVYVAPRKPATP